MQASLFTSKGESLSQVSIALIVSLSSIYMFRVVAPSGFPISFGKKAGYTIGSNLIPSIHKVGISYREDSPFFHFFDPSRIETAKDPRA